MSGSEGPSKRVFQSCIKVKGIHLLPPVITEKQRIELQKYKQQAVKLEKRLQNCRELKKNLEELLNLQPLSDRPQSEITFGDNSHIEALGLCSSRSSSHLQRKLNLTRDIVDITEYSNDGIKIISSEIKMNYGNIESNQGQASNTNNYTFETDSSLSKSSEIRLTSQPTRNKENNNESDDQNCSLNLRGLATVTLFNDMSPNRTPKPRLIRSNSYTLETPSPILLAHLQKFNEKEELTDTKNLSSVEINCAPFVNSEFSSMNTVYNLDPNKIEKTKNVEENIIPRIEVIQTDISVQQISVNGNEENIELLDNTFDLSDPDNQLMQVLQKIPESFSKQIIELIEKQRKDQSERVQKQLMDDFIMDEYSEKSKQHELDRKIQNNQLEKMPSTDNERAKSGDRSYSSDLSISPSQSLYYSVSSSGTLVPFSASARLIDLECEGDRTNESEKFDTAQKSLIYMTDLYKNSNNRKKMMNSSRELFPQRDAVPPDCLQQEWAASVIGAHVRGYLTRRLLKTERVQSLIETIKDALLCALQLHQAENIDESDVELHRRLINQVTAACYAFHDVFFSLSVAEKMSIIALDRHRKIEKAKRPSSAPASRRSRSTSSHSSSKCATPQSRSLTKV